MCIRDRDLCVLGMGRPWPSQVLDQLNSLLLHQLAGSKTVLLREVHYVPGIMANLISNTELDKHGIKTISANEIKQ